MQQNLRWNQLENTILYTSHDVFGFHSHSFYLWMMKNIIDKMIPSGIMSYLIENYFTKKSKFSQFNAGPKVLNIKDFQVCFNIWIGCCAFSVLVFLIEQLRRLKNTSLVRVHPADQYIFDAEAHEA